MITPARMRRPTPSGKQRPKDGPLTNRQSPTREETVRNPAKSQLPVLTAFRRRAHVIPVSDRAQFSAPTRVPLSPVHLLAEGTPTAAIRVRPAFVGAAC